VSALVLTLKGRPPQRLDMAPIVPHLLAGKSEAEIARIALQTTRVGCTVGDAFAIRMGDAGSIRIEGSDRLDRIGHGMTGGEILVEGDVGIQAGRAMQGGRLVIGGDAGPWTASGMRGGSLEVLGSVAERLGGPLAGEIAGMRGGTVLVRGDAGARAGDRLRRGTIVIEGSAGAYAGSRMIAGTLVVCGRTGALPGYLMKRGTLALAQEPAAMAPSFVDCGLHALVALRLFAKYLEGVSAPASSLFRHPVRRFAGDMAVLGKGELLVIHPG
jgi:formylmethanofuran dehydrogenase subunit C